MKAALARVRVTVVLAVATGLVSIGTPLHPAGTSAQTPQRDVAPVNRTTGTATIRGRVVQAGTGEPLRGATVRLNGPIGGEASDRTTDADGRFEITGLPAGRFSLTASKGGFVTLISGQRTGVSGERSTSIVLADGQVIELADFALPRGAVIAGRVLDERGNEVTGARVQAFRWRWDRALPVAAGEGMIDQTDDLGQFRLFGLPAGTYAVTVDALSPSGSGRLTAYYPATYSASEAEDVTIKAGQEVSGLIMTVDRTRMATISGVVRRPDGQPLGVTSVVSALRLPVQTGSSLTARVGPDGSYRFAAVPVGDYVLTAQATSAGDKLFASAQVALDSNLTVNLAMRRGRALRGRYVFEGGAPPPNLAPPGTGNLLGRFTSLDGTPSFGLTGNSWTTHADWTFEVDGFNGRRYRLHSPPVPSGWAVKRITRGAVDVTDAPLEFDGDIEGLQILLTQRITRLSVSVRRSDGTMTPYASVVVFPEDESRMWPWTRYLRRADRPDTNGRFGFIDLPPARYLAVAVENLETGEETNPEQLRRLRQVATSLSLDEGESRTLDLQVVDPGR